ncbi:Putative neutral zinc metallopeptidase [Pirellula sp. SH-Sr6A]|uniref:KPN_02809 family neutral zinc metallopeptidase n=1 Tax=Pirellula sp. SH-Sr6A TaxID=1632865 RepID=UPI00078DE83D|nr:neutral zinc metallopeptidase [Pirellula sp. SH-Sr6A]AMV30982.1 Putative neutral zinc metallopeptidase [Pirellula sp. SH-Sr6A]
MRWEGREESSNIEDRRGMALPAGGMALGGGLGSVVLLIILMLLGANPQQIIEQAGDRPAFQDNTAPPLSPESDKDADLKRFVSVVMKDTEDVWNKLFKEQLGARYQEPKLVLFTGAVRSACGVASSQVGPFYCPGDNNVYLDFDFFRQLKNELGAPGDFAMAYVIAHEVAHHVQNQLGISNKVRQLEARGSKEEANQLSVRLELQADYLAGVWVHHAQMNKRILEKGDLEEALHAASRIGDDFLQKRAKGYVSEESFTHGTSEQRVNYLRKGIETGDLQGMMKLFETSYGSL